MQSSDSHQIKTKIEESEYSDHQNSSSYSLSEYQGPRKEKQKKLQSNDIVEGKWSEEEKIKYVLFVFHHLKIFKSKTKRKNLRVFKTLSQYLGSRTPRQCRSHFQKLMNRFKNLKKMMQFHQSQLGAAQFTEAHQKQTKAIEQYPVDGQSSQKKSSVVCLEASCQTQFPDLSVQHQKALLRIKALEQMIYEPNYLLRHPQSYVCPASNFLNYKGY